MFWLAVVGSRNYTNYDEFCSEFASFWMDNMEGRLYNEVGIVSGGAKGVDKMAEIYADEAEMECKVFLPDWRKYGKSAGFRRNTQIVDACDALVAFWDGKSRGTMDSISKAVLRWQSPPS